jgi:hypothetical protein
MSILLFPKKHLQMRLFRLLFLAAYLFIVFIGFSACSKSINYFDYVSELRSNIFIAKTEAFTLRIYAVSKESPYTTDGVPRETFTRMEAHLIAPEGDKVTKIRFKINEDFHEGEMSYDVVKGEYYYACPIDVSTQKELICQINYGEAQIELTATSVITPSTISPQAALNKIQAEKGELFSSLTDKYGFAGEIYLRLLFEDSTYYYVGIIDRQGNCTAFLMNAETGKILAERQT